MRTQSRSRKERRHSIGWKIWMLCLDPLFYHPFQSSIVQQVSKPDFSALWGPSSCFHWCFHAEVAQCCQEEKLQSCGHVYEVSVNAYSLYILMHICLQEGEFHKAGWGGGWRLRLYHHYWPTCQTGLNTSFLTTLKEWYDHDHWLLNVNSGWWRCPGGITSLLLRCS